jgi:sulfide:quinone oxidoreductase
LRAQTGSFDFMSSSSTSPLRVLVAGGGVAGLEALLALRDLAGDRVESTLLTPEREFVYRPMAVAHPFSRGHAQHHEIAMIAHDLGVELVRGGLTDVDVDADTVVTSHGDRLTYDALLVAVGAGDEPAVEGATTWTPDRDPEVYGGLLRDLEEGYTRRIAFVVPRDVAWPLPAYELALMTGWSAREAGRGEVELSIHTPELEPLSIFGAPGTAALRKDLDELGITVHTGVEITSARDVEADRVVALPRATGPAVPGLQADGRGFIRTDAHGKVVGTERVWAAGDATAFPIKQGGLAAQQADAAAEVIARLAGADVDPQPFKPVLRGVLLTGRGSAWMRHDLSEDPEEGAAARRALFWPPTKIAGRYLSPFLAGLGEAPDGANHTPDGQLVELDLVDGAPAAP